MKRGWRERLVVAATVVAVVALALHPELRLLVPFVDALGLDVFVVLAGAQLWSSAKPLLAAFRRSVLMPAARRAYAVGIFFFGYLGPYVDAKLSSRFRFALQ